jgi:hypothetical protein
VVWTPVEIGGKVVFKAKLKEKRFVVDDNGKQVSDSYDNIYILTSYQ